MPQWHIAWPSGEDADHTRAKVGLSEVTWDEYIEALRQMGKNETVPPTCQDRGQDGGSGLKGSSQ